jgi:hypothetical protein
MVQTLDVRSRDVRNELAANDPLLELTRIMGVDAPNEAVRKPVKEPVDPQLAIEDDFTLDLEQELQLGDTDSVELTAEDIALEADFSSSFDEELSGNLQFGDDVPPVVPSLEDELEALLADEPAPTTDNQDRATQDWVKPELARDVEPVTTSAFQNDGHAETVDDEMAMEAAPWLEPDLEPLMAAEGDVDGDDETITDTAEQETDPVLSQMDRIFGRSNLTATQYAAPAPEVVAPVQAPQYARDEVADNLSFENDLTDNFLEEFDVEAAQFDANDLGTNALQADDFQADDLQANDLPDDPMAAMAQLDLDDELAQPVHTAAAIEEEMPEPTWNEPLMDAQAAASPSFDLGRLVGKTEPEPIVDVADFEVDAITATDDLDIPDFDLSAESVDPATQSFDLDDEYDGYEPPVTKAAVVAVDQSPLDDFTMDMPQADGDGELDFESMLNDELTASVEQYDTQDAYVAGAGVAGAGAAIAGAGAYRTQRSAYKDDLPHVDTMADDIDTPAQYPERTQYPANAARKNTWLVAAAVGAMAVLGAGYYAMSGPSTGAAGTAPVLIKADADPIKVAPETPGGKTVANQDQAVYDKVGGEGALLPTEGQLVSESEEPLDIASVATETPTDANAKGEERVDPALEPEVASGQSADTLAVSPKKVRTVVVKPDGTLVERPAEVAAAIPAEAVTAAPVEAPTAPAQAAPAVAEETPIAETPAPAAQADEPAVVAKAETPAPEANADASVQETQTAAITPEPAPAPAPAEPEVAAPKADAPVIKVVKTKKIKAPVADTATLDADPQTNEAPILDARPADQPVNIVGKTGNAAAAAETQVAAVDAAPTPAGTYSMQIASTPSPEAAKSTYVALTRKFGDVLIGRGVSVQKAEVEGKGTVYRVRIPVGSKQEAAALCQQYKSAGGNCFITK